MKAIKSPWVTGCEAIWKASSQTRWRGFSLSKEKSPPACPSSHRPPSKPIHRASRARIGVSVLLLVMQSKLDQPVDWRRSLSGEHGAHGRVDVIAIVVGVEENAIRGVEAAIPGTVRLQHKSLEEPCGMRQMPFHRARVRHRLDGAVFGRERRSDGAREPADREISGVVPRSGYGMLNSHRRIGNRIHGHLLEFASPV